MVVAFSESITDLHEQCRLILRPVQFAMRVASAVSTATAGEASREAAGRYGQASSAQDTAGARYNTSLAAHPPGNATHVIQTQAIVDCCNKRNSSTRMNCSVSGSIRQCPTCCEPDQIEGIIHESDVNCGRSLQIEFQRF